jgi:hypothetical protein
MKNEKKILKKILKKVEVVFSKFLNISPKTGGLYFKAKQGI